MNLMGVGFGWLDNIWIGLEKLNIITSASKHTLVVEIWDSVITHDVSEYKNFRIGNKALVWKLNYDSHTVIKGEIGQMFKKNGK